MEGSTFSLHYASKLTIKQAKVIGAKSSSHTKSLDWLRCKNATINPKILMINVFSMLFCFHSIIMKSKIILKVANIKPFIDVYNWKVTKYQAVINNNSPVLFK